MLPEIAPHRIPTTFRTAPTASSTLSVFVQSSVTTQAPQHNVVQAASAIEQLISSDSFWTNAKELYSALDTIYNLLVDAHNFTQLGDILDSLQQAGIDPQLISEWHGLLLDSELSVFSADLAQPVWGLFLDKTLDVFLNYLARIMQRRLADVA